MKPVPLLLLVLVTLSGCRDHRPDVQTAVPTDSATRTETECSSALAVLPVDTTASVIRWKGTKFRGRGKHEGTIRLASGQVEVCDSTLVGGAFTIDMRSIEIPDIPEYEPVPRERLRNHLMDDDFFAVETYPTAEFRIGSVEVASVDSFRISGTLTMRGHTQGIEFGAAIPEPSDESVRAAAAFSIDRQLWGVAYRGSELTNDLVDDEIYLDLWLVARE